MIERIQVTNNIDWIWKYLALNLTGYAIQKKDSDLYEYLR